MKISAMQLAWDDPDVAPKSTLVAVIVAPNGSRAAFGVRTGAAAPPVEIVERAVMA